MKAKNNSRTASSSRAAISKKATAKKKPDSGSQAVQAKGRAAKKADPVVHFELPLDDPKRISKFYKQAFGWKMETLGEEHGHYIIATTTDEVDKNGAPKKIGMINGGFYTRDASRPAQVPSLVIGVESVRDAMKRIEKAGGEVLGEPEEIPGIGVFVSFFDTEGNRLSVIEPHMDMKKVEQGNKKK